MSRKARGNTGRGGTHWSSVHHAAVNTSRLARRRCDSEACGGEETLHKGDVCIHCKTGHTQPRDVKFDQYAVYRNQKASRAKGRK